MVHNFPLLSRNLLSKFWLKSGRKLTSHTVFSSFNKGSALKTWITVASSHESLSITTLQTKQKKKNLVKKLLLLHHFFHPIRFKQQHSNDLIHQHNSRNLASQFYNDNRQKDDPEKNTTQCYQTDKHKQRTKGAVQKFSKFQGNLQNWLLFFTLSVGEIAPSHTIQNKINSELWQC